jgi:DNA-binding NarL/FixJ family response regulator
LKDVVLAVASPLIRSGMKDAVHRADGLRVVDEVSRSDEVLPSIARFEPDLVVLESGFRRKEADLLDVLARDFPATAVLVLVDHSFDECAVRAVVDGEEPFRLSEDALERLDDCCMFALRARAKGCLPETSEPEEFLAAVRMVLAGQISAGPWVNLLLSQGRNDDGRDGSPQISARELEVIELIARGMGNKAIAKELGIREQTVKNHLARVMEKLQVDSRLELALQAIKHHLVYVDGG